MLKTPKMVLLLKILEAKFFKIYLRGQKSDFYGKEEVIPGAQESWAKRSRLN